MVDQDVIIMYVFAPLIGLFIFIILKLLRHFKWQIAYSIGLTFSRLSMESGTGGVSPQCEISGRGLVRSIYGHQFNNILPTLNATTSAVFNSIGLNASDIYAVFVGLVGTAVAFGLWLVQVSWPFLLGIAFIYFMWHLARRFTGIGR